MKLPIHALVDSLPQAPPYAPEHDDDLTHDPVVIAVYRWLHGMEEALNRRIAPGPTEP